MSGDEQKRRASDDEAFKYNIVGQQAEIKTKVELLHDMVKMELGNHRKRIETLEEAIVGSISRPGLLEQNRNLLKDMAKLFGIITTAGFVLFKIISPIYDAWVSKWIPQKIAAEVAAEPDVKSKLVRKAVGTPVDSNAQKR